jgi:hypothetical protein
VVKWTDTVSALVGVASFLLAIVGAYIAYRSYQQRTAEIASKNKLDRFNNYLIANTYFENDKNINAVRDAAESGNWSTVTKDHRYYFMAFYEQVALMMQSGLISEDAAFYIYGFELMRAYEDPEFWHNNDPKDDKYWELLRHLYERMFKYSKRYEDRPFPVKDFTF